MGYDNNDNVYQLYRGTVESAEEIKFISFLEDNNPSFLFVVSFNRIDKHTAFKILRLRKNVEGDKENISKELPSDRETVNAKLEEKILDNIKKGHFEYKRQKSIDNIECVPKKNYQYNASSQLLSNTGMSNNIRFSKTLNSSRINTSLASKTPSQRPSLNALKPDMAGQELVPEVFPTIRHNTECFEESEDPFSPRDIDGVKSPDLSEAAPSENDDSFMDDNKNPFVVEEFGKLHLPNQVQKSFIFYTNNGTMLFTFEEEQKLSIFMIKAFHTH